MGLPQLTFGFLMTMLMTSGAVAQSPDQPMTRAQARKELEELAAVGYHPAQASSHRFPFDIEDAEARVAEKRRQDAARISGKR
ncbi:DUF4148 domain-containing protein [Caballeronia sp. LZ034LL]|uniref:DUF4148 domain-containing protein n=1 Tax=Caballeronia sp. LZ034LL TaxID=3038567 RepID=UPI0028580ED0|nr:DUF4148 domain-containing protein [Caballeronia sp. LZ034LL]MDR5837305.1 DUF4148 domain-containing protein [Caballeronia sp. LZ034LL]